VRARAADHYLRQALISRLKTRTGAAACAALAGIAGLGIWLAADAAPRGASEPARTARPAPAGGPPPGRPARRPAGRVLWSGDFSQGLSRYARVSVDPADSAEVVDDPILGARRKALKLTVLNSSADPAQPGSPKHRAQAESPTIIGLDADVYIGLSILIPKDFPRMHNPGDVGNGAVARQAALHSIYGKPYSGSSPQQIGITGSEPDQALRLLRNSTYDYDIPWQIQTERDTPQDLTGRWIDFVIHTKMSTSSSVGFREQWVNTGSGFVKQTFADGSTRLMMQTVDGSNGAGPNYSKLQLYYNDDAWPEATVYFADHRIGTTFDAVAPRSYR
jgi:hypothetical protein